MDPDGRWLRAALVVGVLAAARIGAVAREVAEARATIEEVNAAVEAHDRFARESVERLLLKGESDGR